MRALVDVRVLPMTEPGAQTDAIAWDGDAIVALGRDAVEAAARTAGIEVEEGRGLLVLPGFVDAHMHLLHVGIKRTRPDLRGAASKQEALDRLAEWLASHPGDSPVIAEGWDESDWGEDAFHRTEIDAVAGGRPVVLRRICGHVSVAGSAALPAVLARWPADKRTTSISRGGADTEPPTGDASTPSSGGGADTPSGADADRKSPHERHLVDPATGVLLEEPSLYLNEVLPASPEELARAVQVACDVAHHLGVTTVGTYEQAPLRAALLAAADEGRLRLRVVCSIYLQHLEDALAAGFRTGRRSAPMLHDGGVKLFLDGSLGGHTARLRAPYADHPGHGMANFSDSELDRAMEQAHQAGIQLHVHAIGDGAVEQGLRAFERLRARLDGEDPDEVDHALGAASPLLVQTQAGPLGHRFEHFEIADDEQLLRTAALGVWSSSQPNFVGEWSAAGGLYEQRIGARYLLNNRFRSILAAGIRLAFGSDGMPFGPLFGIASAIQHPDERQRLDIQEALWHYTAEAAASLGRGDVGSLAPGQRADLLLVEGELEQPATQWVLRETVLAGKTVHRGTRPRASDDDVSVAL